MRIVRLLIALSAATLLCAQAPVRMPQYERVYSLKPKEGVFAYSRISPDGKRLAYASQITARPANLRGWTVTVVDLATQNILLSQQGIDAYWSNDGKRIIYSGGQGVTIWNVETGAA